MDQAENIYVVWESGGNSLSQRNVELCRSTDGGKSFAGPYRLSTTGAFGNPNLLVLEGQIHVVWRSLAEDRGTVFHSTSSDGGESFSGPTAIPGTDRTLAPLDDFLPLFPLGRNLGLGLLFIDAGTPGGALYFAHLDPLIRVFQNPLRVSEAVGARDPFGATVRSGSSGPPTVALGWVGRGIGAQSPAQGIFLACSAELKHWPDSRLVLESAGYLRQLAAAEDATGQFSIAFIRTSTEASVLNYLQARCPPRFSADAVVNAASQQVGMLAPGALASIYGTDLGRTWAEAATIDRKTGLVASNLGGVEVRFDEVAAPLLFVRHDQINLQVPFETAGRSISRVRVIANGVTSDVVEIAMRRGAPAFFTFDGSGRGPVIAQNQDGSLNTLQAPAAQDTIVTVYATGQGEVAPILMTGQLGPLYPPFPQPRDEVAVLLADRTGEVVWAGLAPGLLGVLQINFRVPEGLPSGPVGIRLKIGEEMSPDGTIVYVR